MGFVLRALCYVKRKWKKTILLSGVFCITAFTMLGTWGILRISEHIAALISKESNSKITMESVQMENALNHEEVERMEALENVGRINRVTELTVFANGFLPVCGAGELNKVVLHGFDDMLKDSAFEEKICRIVSGREASNEGEVVINQRMADLNKLSLEDEMSFVCGERGKTAKIVGFYLTGNENNQTDAVLTENRIENQIYTVNRLLFDLGNSESYEKLVVYVNTPENLAKTEKQILTIVGEKASVRTFDTAYQKIKLSLNGTRRVTKIVMILMAVTSIFVTGSMLILWMRNRKLEIAVFISMGIPKIEIFIQMLLEILLIWSLSLLLAALCGTLVFPQVGASLDMMKDMDVWMSVSGGSVVILWLTGVFVLTVLNGVSLFPCLIKNPKKILSEMAE